MLSGTPFLLMLLLAVPALAKSKTGSHVKTNVLDRKVQKATTSTAYHTPLAADALDVFGDEDDEPLDYGEEDGSYQTDTTGCPTKFLGRCQCAMMMYQNMEKYVVNCTNAGFTNASMLRVLPDNTEVLIFTGNFLEVLPDNIFGTLFNFDDLDTIDMSNNGIKEIRGKTFHRVGNVKTLILNHNNLFIVESKHHPRVFSSFESLESLHLTNAFTEDVDPKWYLLSLEHIFQDSMLTELKKLHLEQNEIWGFRDPRTFCHLPSLQHLYLGANRLTSVGLDLLCLHRLSLLDLQYNSIRRLNTSDTDQLDRLSASNPEFSVKLTGNPFYCDCRIRTFYEWLQTTKTRVLEHETYRCFEGRPASNENLPVEQLREVECAPEPAVPTSASSVVLGILVFVVLVLLVVVSYMHRDKLRHSCRRLRPSLHAAVQSVHRSRQYRNIDPREEAQEVQV